jgi:heme A synthase
MRLKNSGFAAATAAAMLFSTAMVGTAVAGTDANVQCAGVNSCKGQSACKSANNACKGQNSCKGQGFMEMTKAECDAAKAKAGK